MKDVDDHDPFLSPKKMICTLVSMFHGNTVILFSPELNSHLLIINNIFEHTDMLPESRQLLNPVAWPEVLRIGKSIANLPNNSEWRQILKFPNWLIVLYGQGCYSARNPPSQSQTEPQIDDNVEPIDYNDMDCIENFVPSIDNLQSNAPPYISNPHLADAYLVEQYELEMRQQENY